MKNRIICKAFYIRAVIGGRRFGRLFSFSGKGQYILAARALTTELGSSSRLIFGLFKNMEEVSEAVKPFVELLQKKLGVNEEDAYLLHLEMWMYVHGIAVTIAALYLEWDGEYISRMHRRNTLKSIIICAFYYSRFTYKLYMFL